MFNQLPPLCVFATDNAFILDFCDKKNMVPVYAKFPEAVIEEKTEL